MTTLRAGSATDVGRIRSLNEDSSRIVEGAQLYVVADGMGGHQGGEVASALAVETVEAEAGEATLEALKESVRKANRVIFEKAGSDTELLGMGTTTCAIRVVPGPDGDEIAWVNVGDSRVYLQRDDKLIQLSRDHSLVEDLLRDGQLTAAEAAVHPQRNILTRALGIDIDVDVDGGTVIPFTGDRFLLCSDGLFNEVSADQISAVLRRLADPTEAAEELVRTANEGGGRDNITVVLVDVVDDDGRSAAASAALAAEGSTIASAAAPIGSATVAPEHTATAPVVDPDSAPADAGPVFAGQRSSLPDAGDDYGSDREDPFGDIDHARGRRVTWGVVGFVVALLVIVAVVVGAFVWSSRKTYYVGTDGSVVAVYRGKPGGVLFVKPTLAQSTHLKVADLPEAYRLIVEHQKEFGSKAEADTYLQTLASAARQQADSTTTTTAPATTTTTTPGATTTPPTTTTSVAGG